MSNVPNQPARVSTEEERAENRRRHDEARRARYPEPPAVPALPSWLHLEGVTEADRVAAARLTRSIRSDLADGEHPDHDDLAAAASLFQRIDMATQLASSELPEELGDLDPAGDLRLEYFDGAQHFLDAITGSTALFDVLSDYTRSVDPDEIARRNREQALADQDLPAVSPMGDAAPIPERARYMAAANSLAAAARQIFPLVAEARELLHWAQVHAAGSVTAEDDAAVDELRAAHGVDELVAVVVAFGAMFDALPLVDHQIHCTVVDPEALTCTYS